MWDIIILNINIQIMTYGSGIYSKYIQKPFLKIKYPPLAR